MHKIKKQLSTITVDVYGTMPVADLFNLRQDILKTLHKTGKVNNLVFNFKFTNSLDAYGLGMLVNLKRHCEKQGVKIKITGLHGRTKELFEKTSMDLVFAA